MKILVYRWKAYNYQDIIACFESMGHKVTEVSQELMNYDVDEAFSESLRELILKEGFDFMFTVNYFGLISDLCQELGLIYVSWSCDNPLISMYHQSVFNDCNRIFLFDLSSVKEFESMGVEHVYHLPLAVNVARLDYLRAHSTNQTQYCNEIAFVGSIYERNTYDRIVDDMPEYLRGYFDAVIEAQRDMQGMNIVERMLTPEILSQLETYYKLERSSDRSFSDLGLIFSTTTLGFKIAREQRRSTLIELSKKHAVSLYTQSDASEFIRVRCRGSVDYWSQMPLVFANTRINLNLTIPNIKTGIPLRCLDVMGSGGFLLTNFQAEIPLFFEREKDLICYYSQDDMLEKVDYYLAHEDERKKIARAGYDKVKETCRYEDRIIEMLKKGGLIS